MIFRTILIAGLLTGAGALHAASVYDSGVLEFATTERQSVWGSGAAAERSGTKFIGSEWDEKFEVGEIVGSLKTTTVKDFTFSTRLAAWEECKDSIFSSLCGDRPTDGTFSFTTDTRTGVDAEVKTTGKVGFDFNYQLDAGSTDASVMFNARAVLPDAGTVAVGEAFSLATSSDLSDGKIDVQSPTINASLDAVLKAKVTTKGKGCLIPFGCAVGSGTILDIDEDRELIGLSLGEVVWLDGFTPDGLEITTPLLNQSAALQFNIPTGTPKVELRDKGAPKPDPVPELAIDLAEAAFTLPEFSEEGGVDGDTLKVSGRSDFVDLTVDLDTLFATTGILPPGGISAGFGPIGASFDAYDFDAGPSFDVFQDLTLTPTLMVDMDFSADVDVLGELKRSFRGAWDALPDFKIFETTTFSPKFFVEAVLESTTGFKITLDLTAEFLKGTLSLGAFGFDLLTAKLGPLFADKFELADFGALSIFDDTFDFEGFDGKMLAARSFTIIPEGGVVPSAVPLPVGGVLLLSGLGLLVGFRRRRT